MGEFRREDLKMQKFVLLSDRPIEPYQEALTELLEQISCYRVRGMAVVLLVDPEEEDGGDDADGADFTPDDDFDDFNSDEDVFDEDSDDDL